MYKVFKSGACIGAIALLASCSTSEHFMQDDVYNTRTPLMPPGTDLNDVTDYATFVAKKEQQSDDQERTTYVSPRQYNDYFYNSQYVFYGYSPYMAMTGIGYYGYNGYNGYYSSHPYYNSGYGYGSPFYPTIGFGGYYGGGYNPYYAGNYYYGGNPYYGGYYGSGYYGGGYYGNSNWYTPQTKPNTPGNLGSAHAGTSAGRMGSSNGTVVSYPNQIAARPGGFTPVGRNTDRPVSSSPVITNNNGRMTGGSRSSDFNPGTAARPASSGRTVSGERPTGSYRTSDPNGGSTGNRTFNNNNNNSNRTISSPNTNSRPSSSPTIRSGGGSSGGSVSGGGARSGGRR